MAVAVTAGCAVPNPIIPTHENQPVITVAVAETIEHEIVTQLYAFALSRAGYRVQIGQPQGDSAAAYAAVTSGQASMTVVYTGDVVRRAPGGADAPAPLNPADSYAAMLAALPPSLTAGEPSRAEDKPAAVVSRNTSITWGLRTMSDLSGRCEQLRLASTPAIALEDDIRSALRGYDCQFASVDNSKPRPRDVVDALRAGTAGVGLVYSTDPVLYPDDIVTLTDDQHLVAAENMVPVFATGMLNDEERDVIDAVSAVLTTDDVTTLNAQVESGRVPVVAVVTNWLTDNDL